MLLTTILGLLSALVSLFGTPKHPRRGLKASFVLIFFFLALRYDFGNDYQAYLEIFDNTSQVQQFDLNYFLLSFHEPGWLVLNWMFRHLGFFPMLATLALLNCCVYYDFISKHVPEKYFWMAIFLYTFYPGFMLIHASAMRQSVAIMLFVFSIKFLFTRNAVKFIFIIGLASLFHFTALILAPLYLIVLPNRRFGLASGSACLFAFGSLFIFGSHLSPLVKFLISNVSDKYVAYQDPGIASSGLGFIYYGFLLITTLFYDKFQTGQVSLIFKIAVVGFLFVPLPLIIDMTGRLLMYFTPATIIVFPAIIRSIKTPIPKFIFSTFIVVVTLFQFFQFFHSETYRDGYGIYKTIFAAPKPI